MRRALVFLAAGALALFALGRARATAPAGPSGQYEPYNRDDVAIHDVYSGLTWERMPAAVTLSQADAAKYCAALTLQQATTWRLPTYKELLTIVDEDVALDYENGAPTPKAIDLNAFPATAAQCYWSSSTTRGGQGWCVDFSDGTGRQYNPNTGIPVRCVRDR